MKLTARRITEEDYSTIVEWWKSWPEWEPLSQEMLPENGTGGIIIEKEGEPIVAGFLYGTNSKIAWMEWIISNPKYRIKKDREQAILLLIDSLEQWAYDGGFKLILSIGRSKSLIDKHKKLGYTVDEDRSKEIIKKIR